MTTKATTTYGTIPTATTTTTSPSSSSSLSFFPRASFNPRTILSHRRPWREFLSPTTLSLPHSYSDATARIRRNLNYFRYNYSLISLLILFLSLLYHPISMIVFLAIFTLWLWLYFSRDNSLQIYGRSIDDRVILIGLFIVTVVALVLTRVGINVLVALLIAVVLIGLHAAFRGVEDLFLDADDEDVDGALVDVVEGQPLRPTYAAARVVV